MAIDDTRARIQAQREERKINSQQQGLGGTPLQGRNPVGSAGQWGGQAAPSTVQGQGRLGPRQPDRTWQQSARDGAFGTGAKDRVRLQDDIAAGKTIAASGQQLKDRQSLFADMQKPGADMAALRQRGQALGITDSGWAKGLAKAGPAPTANQPQVAATPAPAAAPPPQVKPSGTGIPWGSQPPSGWTNGNAGGRNAPLDVAAPRPQAPATAAPTPAAPAPAPSPITATAIPPAAQPMSPLAARPTWQQVAGLPPSPPPTASAPAPASSASPAKPAAPPQSWQSPAGVPGYDQRMAEGMLGTEDLKKPFIAAGKAVKRGIQKARRFSERTNAWADQVRA